MPTPNTKVSKPISDNQELINKHAQNITTSLDTLEQLKKLIVFQSELGRLVFNQLKDIVYADNEVRSEKMEMLKSKLVYSAQTSTLFALKTDVGFDDDIEMPSKIMDVN